MRVPGCFDGKQSSLARQGAEAADKVAAIGMCGCAYVDSCMPGRDYYGNKRLELAGGLLALLFEDLFKRMNSDLRKQATKALSKQTRSTEHFDWVKHIDRSIITEGFEHAVASGNWTIKRFRMDRKGTTQVRGYLKYLDAALSRRLTHARALV